MGQSIETFLEDATFLLNGASDSARLDAEMLLMHVLKKDRSYLYAWPEQALSIEELDNISVLLQRRKQGEPVAYLIGYKDFWSLRLQVTSQTLIPRPETETLVEQAVALIRKYNLQNVLDLGTGSGAIALAIAKECPGVSITAVDKSDSALLLAEQNKRNNQIHNVEFVKSDWYQALGNAQFELVVSNPPYVAESDPHLSKGDVRFEPQHALIAGKEGLDDLAAIIGEAQLHLYPSGWLICEHGYQQALPVTELFINYQYQNIKTYQDLAGQDRVTLGRCPDPRSP